MPNYVLNDELKQAIQQVCRQFLSSFQPRPLTPRRQTAGGTSGRIKRRWGRVHADGITAASDNLVANWGSGEVYLANDTTGVLDGSATEVDNPLQIAFEEDYYVEVDTSFTPPQVKSGTCTAWNWTTE